MSYDVSIQRLDEAQLNAWPALQQMVYDGWLLRFGKGYTKRANSVNPLYPPVQRPLLDLDTRIAACESIYAARDLPLIFRITPLAPPDLDDRLVARGCQKISPTLVQTRDLGEPLPPVPAGDVRHEALDAWIEIFCRISGQPVALHQTHKTILSLIPTPCFLAVLVDGDTAVACGVAVLERDVVGVFDLVTAPEHRGKGYGTTLITRLLAWGREQGAARAYLGVEQDNAPARHVYESKLGFETRYTYWYRRV